MVTTRYNVGLLLSFALVTCSGCGRNAGRVEETGTQSGREGRSDRPAGRDDLLGRLGYKESTSGREVLTEALGWANLILGDDVPFTLSPGWQPEPGTKKEAIPVYLAEPDGPIPTSIAFVPDGRRCVVVNGKEFGSLEALLGNTSANAVKQPAAQLLAVVLLHEAGHLFLGHSGCMDERGDRYGLTRSYGPDLNRETKDKEQEDQADAFVAREVTSAQHDTKDIARSMRGLRLGSAITMVRFNLAATRLSEHFGSGVLGSKEAFWDRGASHPNMELRVLRINARMEPDPASVKLVEDFEAMRKKVEAEVLYERSPAKGAGAGGAEDRP